MGKHTTRNRVFGIGGVIVILGVGMLAFTGQLQFGDFTGTFGNELYLGEVVPLTLFQNSGVDCKMFSQLTETDTNGNSRSFAFNTVTFDVQTTFELVSTSTTLGTLQFIDTTARVACDQVGNIDIGTFQMVGKSVSTRIFATQENGQKIFIKEITRSITSFPRDVLNNDLIIPTGSIRADEIDAKLTSTSENYVTRVSFVIDADLEFIGSATGTLLNVASPSIQHILTARVFNEITDPPQPVSNSVNLVSVTGVDGVSTTLDLEEIRNAGNTVRIKVIGTLPQWQSTEGVPNFEVRDPNGRIHATLVTMPIEQLIDSSTNTYRFTRSMFNLGSADIIETGQWTIEMRSNQDVRRFLDGTPSADIEFIRIIDTFQPPIICPTGTNEVIQNGVVVGCIQPPSTCPTDQIFNPVTASCEPPPPDCDPPLKLLVTSSGTLLCILDSDDDGIPDSQDVCPNEQEDGFQALFIDLVREADPFDGCSVDTATVCNGFLTGMILETTEECTGALQPEDFLTGEIRTVGTIVFNDLSIQSFVVGDTGFLTNIGTITPLTVTTTFQGEDKIIERFEYEVFYIYPNTADAIATFLEDTDIRFTPTVILSSAVSRTATSGAEATSDSLGVNGEIQEGLGFGLSLGKGLILSKQIQALVTQEDSITGDPAPITEGQTDTTVTIQINADGDFTLRRDTTSFNFDLQDNFVSFKNIAISNRGSPVATCPAPLVQDFDRTTGTFLGCVQPDSDGDGVPNDRDQCPTEAGASENAGCPVDNINQCLTPLPVCADNASFVVPTCRCEVDDQSCPSGQRFNESEQMCEVIPPSQLNGEEEECKDGTLTVDVNTREIVCVKGSQTIVIGGNNGKVCTLTTPQFCPDDDGEDGVLGLSLDELLIIGGIGFIIIGVTVAVLRRR